MNIRFAKPNDKLNVLSLFTQLGVIINKKLNKFDPKNEDAEKHGSLNYDNVMKSSIVKIFVIEDQNEIVGAASFFILTDMISGEKFAHIDDFVIDQKQRGKGYGRRLMYGILKYAQRSHIGSVKLTSSLAFTEAHAFYERIGGKYTQKVFKFDPTGIV